MKKFFALVFAAVACVAASATDYYVSPTGDDNGSGTKNAPLRTVQKALALADAGSTVYLRGGVYKPGVSDIMRPLGESLYDCVYYLDKNGTADAPIVLCGYPGEKVTFDLSDVKTGNRIMGFCLKGDYWHLKGFDIVGIQVTQTGHTQSINVGLFGGSNCVVEQVNMHDGMGIGVYAIKGKNNLVLNCDAYNNYDSVSENGVGGNCDGFGFHLNSMDYTGNRLVGCRAWRNSDDGFDLINNAAPVEIDHCWAWQNGYDANMVSRGDGTGIKSGGYGMKANPKVPATVPRNVITNSICWANKNQGFYANHHLGGLDFHNNSAYQNPRNFNMVCRKSAQEAVDVDGYNHCLSGNVAYAPTQDGGDCVNIDLSTCTLSGNTFCGGTPVSADDFESLDASQLLLPRQPDGSLPAITFLRLKGE